MRALRVSRSTAASARRGRGAGAAGGVSLVRLGLAVGAAAVRLSRRLGAPLRSSAASALAGSRSWRPACCRLRKSVAYQPLPFSWKPAAETSLTSASLPHGGTGDERRVATASAAPRARGRRRAAVFVDRHDRTRSRSRLRGTAHKALDSKRTIIASIIRACGRACDGVVRRTTPAQMGARPAQPKCLMLSRRSDSRDGADDGRLLGLVDPGGGPGRRRARDRHVLPAGGRHRVRARRRRRAGSARRSPVQLVVAGVLAVVGTIVAHRWRQSQRGRRRRSRRSTSASRCRC